MDTKEKGDLAEAKAVAMLMEAGFTVSLPTTEHCRYDIVADDGECLYKLQVKCGRRDDYRVVFNTSDIRSNRTGSRRRTYTKNDIDAFLVYDQDRDNWLWVPVEEATDSAMTIRVEEPDSKFAGSSTANYAEDYQVPCPR